MTTEEEMESVFAGINMMGDIRKFHEKYGLAYEGKPRSLSDGLEAFRIGFLHEELEEYKNATHALSVAVDEKDDAAITEQLENQLDALVDLVYVALGTAYLQGFDFETAWVRVQEKNMQKVRAKTPEASKRGWAGDVVKPEGWTPPRHTDLVEDHAHRQEEFRF